MQIFREIVASILKKIVETKTTVTEYLHDHFQNSFLVMDWLHNVRLYISGVHSLYL